MQEKDFPEDPEKSFFFISSRKLYQKSTRNINAEFSPPDFRYLPHFLTSVEFAYI